MKQVFLTHTFIRLYGDVCSVNNHTWGQVHVKIRRCLFIMFYQTYGELVERRNNQWAYESGYLQPDKWLEQRRHKKAHRRGYLKKNSLFDGEEYI